MIVKFGSMNTILKNLHKCCEQDAMLLDITHNHIPDQTIEHSPKMLFEEITGTVGGLMGMWLGLSALAIFNYILHKFN